MKKADLIAKCKDLGIDPSGLDTNAKLKAAIEAKEAEIAEKEAAEAAAKAEAEKAAEKAEAEQAEADAAAEEVAKEEASEEESEEESSEDKETVDSWEDEAGVKWGFKDSAPKRLNIDGRSYTREEILTSEELISELVYGKNPHLTRIIK